MFKDTRREHERRRKSLGALTTREECYKSEFAGEAS